MNIVVCYKIVPDEQDAVVQADRTLSFERAALKIGDYDLNAVEAGAQLASASGASLVSLTAGGDPVEDSKLKKAILARGPHENVAVKDASLPEAGSAVTARVLAAAVKQLDDVSLVLCGEGSAPSSSTTASRMSSARWARWSSASTCRFRPCCRWSPT